MTEGSLQDSFEQESAYPKKNSQNPPNNQARDSDMHDIYADDPVFSQIPNNRNPEIPESKDTEKINLNQGSENNEHLRQTGKSRAEIEDSDADTYGQTGGIQTAAKQPKDESGTGTEIRTSKTVSLVI